MNYPPFDLSRLFNTVFKPKQGERVSVLIDLEDPRDVVNLKFLEKNFPIQKKAYEIFYLGLKKLLGACDFFAYKMTGGSNLELSETVFSPEGKEINLVDIYQAYDIILFITKYSATAPATASAKKIGFRGATMHGLNEIILNSGLAVDYNQVSHEAEKLRQGLTGSDSADIHFEVEQKPYHLHIDLGRQEAQKSHGLCYEPYDVANLPAGEVYFVPQGAEGSFPIKFEEDQKTIGLMQVKKGRVEKVNLIRGNPKLVEALQHKFTSDPATGILGELGFGTQVLPYSGSDIQDEKIFGTFHLATGRNDHLQGPITLDRFKSLLNASHDDILFSSTKTPEIEVKKVILQKGGKPVTIIENYEPTEFLLNLKTS